MRQPPTGTVTFLFTDIEGSTKLWEQHPDQMRPALARHDHILRDSIEAHDGYVFKTVGDAFCAAFAVASDALAAALAAQQTIETEPWTVRVRMALHTGNTEERDGDYFGPPVNRVARLLSTGHGRQILLSLAAEELVCGQMPAGTSLLDLGMHRLKDLSRPERVFQLLHPSLATDFPPLRSLDNPKLPNNLPQQPTSFIGRENEVVQVKDLAQRSRLVTLAGSGGAGKSRLSLQVAADVLDQFPDGAWLVELASLSDSALVPQAVADVLGIKEQIDKTIAKTLVSSLQPKRLLLVLDNCEHLVAACAALAADLLRDCPGVHLLATSRESLNVAGEQTYRVPSLSLPDLKQTQTVESLAPSEAVRLFVERAQAVQQSFVVTDMNALAVAQVCVHLDGIPLAIELAAARVRTLSVQQIVERVKDCFSLLTGGPRTVLPRQQTLRATIDWSYGLLNAQEKSIFQRLSVFVGGCTLESAEIVCGSGIPPQNVLDIIASLSDKSLVVVDHIGDEVRYRMLETLRQYALNRLVQSNEIAEMRQRHLNNFLSLAELASSEMLSPAAGKWLSRLEVEHDNFRAALSWCESQTVIGTEYETENLRSWLRMCVALSRFWQIRGYYSEGSHWLNMVLSRADGIPISEVRANALKAAGSIESGQGNFNAARNFHQESLDFFRNVGDLQGTADALGNLGIVAWSQRDYAVADDLLQQSLVLSREIEDSFRIANSLNNLGNVAFEQGEHSLAKSQYQESLTLMRQIGEPRCIANTLNNLATVAISQMDYSFANVLLHESFDLAGQIGDLQGVANCLHNLGAVAATLNNFVEALNFYKESLSIYKQVGDLRGVSHSLNGLGIVAGRQDNAKLAGRLLGAAKTIQLHIGVSQAADHSQMFDETRRTEGNEAFFEGWDLGCGMTFEQSVNFDIDKAAV